MGAKLFYSNVYVVHYAKAINILNEITLLHFCFGKQFADSNNRNISLIPLVIRYPHLQTYVDTKCHYNEIIHRFTRSVTGHELLKVNAHDHDRTENHIIIHP